MTTEGHNSGFNKEDKDSLKSFVERIERLNEEKRGIAGDISELFTEAKNKGFDPKIMRKVIKLRYMGEESIKADQEQIDIYCHALGMLPLFEAAQKAEAKAKKAA